MQSSWCNALESLSHSIRRTLVKHEWVRGLPSTTTKPPRLKCAQQPTKDRTPLLFIAPRSNRAITPSLGNLRDDRTHRWNRPGAAPVSDHYNPSIPMPTTCPCSNIEHQFPTITTTGGTSREHLTHPSRIMSCVPVRHHADDQTRRLVAVT
jgi:hypothetical protein